MGKRILNNDIIKAFEKHLKYEEKSQITIDKYLRDVKSFMLYAENNAVNKDTVLAYKQMLTEKYAVRSVNSKLASLNCLFSFLGWNDCKVKSLKIQRQAYISEEKELTKVIQFANVLDDIAVNAGKSASIIVVSLNIMSLKSWTSGMSTITRALQDSNSSLTVGKSSLHLGKETV